MSYAIDSEEVFIKSINEFRLTRAETLEKEYHDTVEDICNQRFRNELYDEIMSLLGMNMNLLIERST